jgi:hypothetical protein
LQIGLLKGKGGAVDWTVTHGYPKPPVKGFRVEVQFNRAAIQKYKLDDLDAWTNLPEVMAKRVAFFRIDWNRLTAYVRRHFPRDPEAILEKARELRGNLDKLLRSIRQIGVSNPPRFLKPMLVNEDIARALETWRRRWQREGRI